MGRQVGIVATQKDVDEFLSFLRGTTEIAVFKGFAPSIEELWIERPQLPSDWMVYIWNKRFAWNPEYLRVGEKAYHSEMIGWYYVSNTHTAPILEMDPGNVSKARAGRIYWSKYFAAPHGLNYDVDSFAEWYESVVRWIRKNGRKVASERLGPYYLPVAWSESKSGSRQQSDPTVNDLGTPRPS